MAPPPSGIKAKIPVSAGSNECSGIKKSLRTQGTGKIKTHDSAAKENSKTRASLTRSLCATADNCIQNALPPTRSFSEGCAQTSGSPQRANCIKLTPNLVCSKEFKSKQEQCKTTNKKRNKRRVSVKIEQRLAMVTVGPKTP